ncbi:MAG: alpha/beta hydrolase [Myxococcota bacterium]
MGFVGDEHWVERPDGTRILTRVAGEGPETVVLVHGYGVDMREWDEVAERLPDVRRIAFDLRGHGGSTIGRDGVDPDAAAGDYRAVLEAHDVRDAVLVGHSTGGFLGLRFLLEHPDVVRERLRGCLLVATFAGDVSRQNLQNQVQIPLIQSGLLVAMVRFGPIGRAFVRSLAGDRFDAAWVDGFLDAFLANDHWALVPLLRALVRQSDYPRLGQIALPCRIVVGDKDHTTPTFHADDLHAGIAGSTLRRLPGMGHLLNWEAPDVLVEEIRALLG